MNTGATTAPKRPHRTGGTGDRSHTNNTSPRQGRDAMSASSIATVSERKLAANRANAQKSTGPRTEAGKRNASLNALTHGLRARLTTQTLVCEHEREDFQALADALHEE